MTSPDTQSPPTLDTIRPQQRPSRPAHTVRPPLKKMLFLVQRPGEDITAEWELFFFHFATPPPPPPQKKNSNFFYPPKKEGKTGHNFGHPLDKLLFKGGLSSVPWVWGGQKPVSRPNHVIYTLPQYVSAVISPQHDFFQAGANAQFPPH